MSLEVKGKIVKVLEVEKGTSKAGKEWEKMNFVIDTGDQYNPEVCFQLFGSDKVEDFKSRNKVGDSVEVAFNVSSREYNGKYYHNLDAWKIKGLEGIKSTEESIEKGEQLNDDLPF